MYEHVGMGDNHHRRRSDDWQTFTHHDHFTITKEQRIKAKLFLKTSKEKMKTSSNRYDRSLGGDCWNHSFTILFKSRSFIIIGCLGLYVYLNAKAYEASPWALSPSHLRKKGGRE